MNCMQLDTNCKVINPTTKVCAQCYPGYGLNSNSKCQDINTLPAEQKKYHMNCSKFDLNGVCTQCYFRWVLSKDTQGTFCK
jgi:hypothetical protein